jgi:cell division protein FtsB
MRDISHRLARRRSRFAAPEDPVRRRLRWAWLAVALWLLWIGLFSEHSIWRFARLGRDNSRATSELARTRERVARLEAERSDPQRMRERGEKALRENGGMARKGEIIYQVDDVVPPAPSH